MTAEGIKEYLEAKLQVVRNNKKGEYLTDLQRAEYIGQEWLLEDILKSIR